MQNLIALSLALATTWAPVASACTSLAFKAQGQTVFGKNYDWHQQHGRVLINPRNLKKSALVLRPSEKAATWTSKFGSVTFNQHGQDLPLGGLNEAGLVVEVMWLDTSVYPKPDALVTLNELQWIQYQLDNFSTTKAVVARAPSLRVSPILARVHYLVCDVSKDCATFEYVNGKLTIHHDQTLPVSVLANSTYAESNKYTQKFEGFGGMLPLPKGPASLARFARAAGEVKRFSGGSLPQARAYAFRALDAVKQKTTLFQIVYSAKAQRVDFRTSVHTPIRTIHLKDHSFSCLDGVKWLDAHDTLNGDLKDKFMAFDTQSNLALVRDGMKGFESQLPAGIDLKVAMYPKTFACQE